MARRMRGAGAHATRAPCMAPAPRPPPPPCRRKPRRRPLPPGYFAAPSPRGAPGSEQFFAFTALAAWLLQRAGAPVPAPKEFDDPNAVLAGLLGAARALGGGAAAAAAAAPPPRLAAGWGPEVCALLDALAGAAVGRARGGAQLGPLAYAPDA
jgi:hypothetical protein